MGKMFIKEVLINNFKCFEKFELRLNEHLNILVGDNEAGKSTILEAINLVLSGILYGRYLRAEITQSLFNNKTLTRYLMSLKTAEKLPPPAIIIELFLEIEDPSLNAKFTGNRNSRRVEACGIKFEIHFDDKYQAEYGILMGDSDPINSLPVEYYTCTWSSFAGNEGITPKVIPIKSSLIDSSGSRYQNGSDVYISRIVRDLLSDEHKVQISQAHRKLRDTFAENDAVKKINEEIKQKNISEKKVELSVDMATKDAWETTLTTYLDDIPFNCIGKGEQAVIKTRLALEHKKAKEASVLLLEEPENHLSHSRLNKLIKCIKDTRDGKQVIFSTHSSFVANKIGLGNLVLLDVDESSGFRKETRVDDLTEETKEYFEKLSGYDTLRFILCKKAILVEGPSDELVVQKAYLDKNGKLPIEDEVDVISVGTSFLRFLEIANKIGKTTCVVTDNDGDYQKNIVKKYAPYSNAGNIKICADNRENLKTLEPQIADVNDLDILRKTFALAQGSYPGKDTVIEYMTANKTECALRIFKTAEKIKFPNYILAAINDEA